MSDTMNVVVVENQGQVPEVPEVPVAQVPVAQVTTQVTAEVTAEVPADGDFAEKLSAITMKRVQAILACHFYRNDIAIIGEEKSESKEKEFAFRSVLSLLSIVWTLCYTRFIPRNSPPMTSFDATPRTAFLMVYFGIETHEELYKFLIDYEIDCVAPGRRSGLSANTTETFSVWGLILWGKQTSKPIKDAYPKLAVVGAEEHMLLSQPMCELLMRFLSTMWQVKRKCFAVNGGKPSNGTGLLFSQIRLLWPLCCDGPFDRGITNEVAARCADPRVQAMFRKYKRALTELSTAQSKCLTSQVTVVRLEEELQEVKKEKNAVDQQLTIVQSSLAESEALVEELKKSRREKVAADAAPVTTTNKRKFVTVLSKDSPAEGTVKSAERPVRTTRRRKH